MSDITGRRARPAGRRAGAVEQLVKHRIYVSRPYPYGQLPGDWRHNQASLALAYVLLRLILDQRVTDQ